MRLNADRLPDQYSPGSLALLELGKLQGDWSQRPPQLDAPGAVSPQQNTLPAQSVDITMNVYSGKFVFVGYNLADKKEVASANTGTTVDMMQCLGHELCPSL
ncbi:hypothetical protein PDE_09533 [Penicillium oxalicum 114-2]|uniref:Uncharacterized protein n=1 Tax=Penicillium oxalicum (strain 114-2 / CGMCC 5302) TaxID=933388 RepID=S7ZVU8_PENO1|nr:hypothetical protein PDE_09533 [Penicillium oxalicum 114-2]